MAEYVIQEHAEWAENHGGIDQDFEADTLDKAHEIAAEIVSGGSMYVIYRVIGVDENGDEVWEYVTEGGG